MIKRYKCKETFYLEKCDDDDFLIGETFVVAKGGEWQEDTEDKYRLFGGPDTARLEKVNANDWIEITREMLEQYFERQEEVQQNEKN